MRARNPSSSKVLSSTAKKSWALVKQSPCAYRLYVQAAMTFMTIFTRTFLRDRSLQSNRLDSLRTRDARQGEENPDHRRHRDRQLSTGRAIRNDPADKPAVERRSLSATTNSSDAQER